MADGKITQRQDVVDIERRGEPSKWISLRAITALGAEMTYVRMIREY
jgi:hypothetical protein